MDRSSNFDRSIFSNPYKLPAWPWVPSNPHLNGYQTPFQGQNGRIVMVTTYFHLATRLRSSGAIILLSLCAFMECKRKFHHFLVMINYRSHVPCRNLCKSHDTSLNLSYFMSYRCVCGGGGMEFPSHKIANVQSATFKLKTKQ